MQHMPLELRPFDTQAAEIIRPWFTDPLTQKWLGDEKWIDNIFRLQHEPQGAEFRGQQRIAYHAFIAYDGEKPVGFIDGGITDKWVKYGGEQDGVPIYLEVIDELTTPICFVTNPTERGKGYATAMIKRLVKRPEYTKIKIFEAGVNPDNPGSIKALEAAGFVSDYVPDFEGMYYFLLHR